MDPLDETPTRPVDYALLSAAYSALLGTVAFAASRRGRQTERICTDELLPLGVATFALSKTLVHEKVEAWVRRPFVEYEGTPERRPRGRGLRYAVGELMTCTRCTGTWSALGLVALRLTRPEAGRTVISVLAATGINDFLQSSFVRSKAGASIAEQRKAADADADAGGDGTGAPWDRGERAAPVPARSRGVPSR
jgi:hypothetical protein